MAADDATFIVRLDAEGDGPRLAVKDIIDVAGVPTTAGCPAVADDATPAAADAPCLAGARAAGARIVGKTNLHELAFGVTGINPWFGTPVNPLDPALVPGGSSSGSAVAVATGGADVALGSDTGGSVRIPAACCGVVGLKTTWGRVPLQGVWPLAVSLDTIGPMARDTAGVIVGMQLLEPGFVPADRVPSVVGRLRHDADPRVDAAVDAALADAGFDVVDVDLPEWESAGPAAIAILLAEAWDADGELLRRKRDRVSDTVAERLELGSLVTPDQVAESREAQRRWRSVLDAVFERVELLALPTLTRFPPRLESGEEVNATRDTLPVNLAGIPALALPVPSGGPVPASLQLLAPSGGEEALVAGGLVVESAVAR